TAAASVRSTEAALAYNATWPERGQIDQPANVHTTPAVAHPRTRSGSASTPPGLETASTNASISAVWALRKYPPSTPSPDSTNATIKVASPATPTFSDASVPITISGTPASAASAYASTRGRTLPPKSANTNSAIEPKTRKVAYDPPRCAIIANARSSGTMM